MRKDKETIENISNMSEMTKYGDWYERMGRTIQSRGKEMSVGYRKEWGILEVINYEAALDDGMSDLERMVDILRRGTGVDGRRVVSLTSMGIARAYDMSAAVLVDSALRSSGMGNPVRIYSGVVFRSAFEMHMYCMRHRGDYPNLNMLGKLVN